MVPVAERELRAGTFGPELPEKLKKLRVSPNYATSPDGFTPLHWACYHDKPKVLQPLIEGGANVSMTTKLDWTAVHICAIRGMDSCLQTLLTLEPSMDITAKDKRGYTAAHLAAIHGNQQTLRLLIEAGSDVQERDTRGWTLLHHAAYHGRLSILRWLLGEWVDPMDDTDSVIKKMDKDKASLDALNNDGNSPLHLAAAQGHLQCLEILIRHVPSPRASCASVNNQGQTARNVSEKYSRHNCVAFLRDAETQIHSPSHPTPSTHGSDDRETEIGSSSHRESDTSSEEAGNDENKSSASQQQSPSNEFSSASQLDMNHSQDDSTEIKRQLGHLKEQLEEEREKRETLETEVEELHSQLQDTNTQLGRLELRESRAKKPAPTPQPARPHKISNCHGPRGRNKLGGAFFWIHH